MSSMGVETIIQDNASNQSIECPQKNQTNTTSRRTTEDWVSAENNEALVHQLLKYRFESSAHSPSRRSISPGSSCETLTEYWSRTGQNQHNLGVCMVDSTTKLRSVTECLSMDSRLNSLLSTFSQDQSLDRPERPSQLSCLDSYSSFLCSDACQPCSSDGPCQGSCIEFKDKCQYWPPSNSMQLSAPESESSLDWWTGDPFFSLQAQFGCPFSNTSSCSFVQNSLGSLGWISDVTSTIDPKNNVVLRWSLTHTTLVSAPVGVSVKLVSTTAPQVDQWRVGDILASRLQTNSFQFNAPQGTHGFSLFASQLSSLIQSPISTEVIIVV